MIYISGPGHGGQAMVANNYLEGVYSKFYPEITEDEAKSIAEKLTLEYINKKWVGKDAGKFLKELGIDADPRLIICECENSHPFVQVEMIS